MHVRSSSSLNCTPPSLLLAQYKAQSGFITALIKYGQDSGKRIRNMTSFDLDYAKRFVDADLMDVFNYRTPDALR
jgi:hypothetical protein